RAWRSDGVAAEGDDEGARSHGGENLAALGGRSKLPTPAAEQRLQLAVDAAERLEAARGQGRVGLGREALRLLPARRERRVGRRGRAATEGQQRPQRCGPAPALAAPLAPRQEQRVDPHGWTAGGRLGEQGLLEEQLTPGV